MSHFKNISKISLKALLSWILINAVGFILSAIVFSIGFFILLKSINLGHAGHASAISIIMMTIMSRPLSSLFLAFIFFSPFLFFILANQYVIKQLAQKLIKDNFDTTINPFLQGIIQKVKNKNETLFTDTHNFLKIKTALIEQVQNSSENKWLKRLINLAIKKMHLDKNDLLDSNHDIEKVMIDKIKDFIETTSTPSFKNMIVLIIFQWFLVLLIGVLPLMINI